MTNYKKFKMFVPTTNKRFFLSSQLRDQTQVWVVVILCFSVLVISLKSGIRFKY